MKDQALGMLQKLRNGVTFVRGLGTILWASDAEFLRMYAQRARTTATQGATLRGLRTHWSVLHGVRQLSKLSAYLAVPTCGILSYCVTKTLANRACSAWSAPIAWLSSAVACGVTLRYVNAYVTRRMQVGETLNADVQTVLH